MTALDCLSLAIILIEYEIADQRERIEAAYIRMVPKIGKGNIHHASLAISIGMPIICMAVFHLPRLLTGTLIPSFVAKSLRLVMYISLKTKMITIKAGTLSKACSMIKEETVKNLLILAENLIKAGKGLNWNVIITE